MSNAKYTAGASAQTLPGRSSPWGSPRQQCDAIKDRVAAVREAAVRGAGKEVRQCSPGMPECNGISTAVGWERKA
eukprot:832556-Pelagomonas_calceolata.AAC.2